MLMLRRLRHAGAAANLGNVYTSQLLLARRRCSSQPSHFETARQMINSASPAAAVADYMHGVNLASFEVYVRTGNGDDEHGIADEGVACLIDAIGTDGPLTELVLYGDGLALTGAQALGDALRMPNGSLCRLAIHSANAFDECSTAVLADALRGNATLRRLELHYSSVGASGLVALADALRTNTGLEILNLQGALVTAGAAGAAEATEAAGSASSTSVGAALTALGDALHVNTSLKTLILSHNELGADGCRALAPYLAGCSLRSVSLTDVGMDDDAAIAIAHGLRANRSLSTLDVRLNDEIGTRGDDALDDLLDERLDALEEVGKELSGDTPIFGAGREGQAALLDLAALQPQQHMLKITRAKESKSNDDGLRFTSTHLPKRGRAKKKST